MTALREIFITFFDTSNSAKASSDKEKLLVSMETSEQSLNPFYDHTNDDELLELQRHDSNADFYITSNSNRFSNILPRMTSISPINVKGRGDTTTSRNSDFSSSEKGPLLLSGNDPLRDRDALERIDEAENDDSALSPNPIKSLDLVSLDDTDEGQVSNSIDEMEGALNMPNTNRRVTI